MGSEEVGVKLKHAAPQDLYVGALVKEGQCEDAGIAI